MRRVLAASVITLATTLTLTACGFGGDDSDGGSGDGTTLNLLVPSYSDKTKSLWEEIIAGFKKENGDVSVNLEVQSWDNINDVVRTKVQAGKAPDILNIDAYGGFAGDDLLYPASDILSEDRLADFQDSFAQNASLDGKMYGLPLIASARVLFYNKDLLTRAGVATPPTTWEQLLAAGKKVNALGGGVFGYGMPLGNEEAQAETSIWTFGNGGEWAADGKITAATPQNTEAVAFMKRMIDEGATQPDPGATDRTPMLDVFIQGKIAMAVGLPPTIGQIAERNAALNYGTAPIPTKDGSPVTLGVADHLMAFKNDGGKQEAIKAFLDYFYATDNYLKFVDAEGFLPTTKSGADKTANAEKFASFLKAMPSAKFYPSTNAKWSATQGALQTLVGQIGTGKDAAAVLAEVQAKADQG